jgi:hypothetical protein
MHAYSFENEVYETVRQRFKCSGIDTLVYPTSPPHSDECSTSLRKRNNARYGRAGTNGSYLAERKQQELFCAHHFLEILQGEPVRPAVQFLARMRICNQIPPSFTQLLPRHDTVAGKQFFASELLTTPYPLCLSSVLAE